MTRVPAAMREMVRERANNRCEYCGKPEKYSPYSHHADHVIPAKRHNGATELYNLAWACFDCNTNKGGDIAAYDEVTHELTPLFNPRTQVRDDHFEMTNAVFIGKTAVGRVTIRLLQMNDSDRVEARRELIEGGLW